MVKRGQSGWAGIVKQILSGIIKTHQESSAVLRAIESLRLQIYLSSIIHDSSTHILFFKAKCDNPVAPMEDHQHLRDADGGDTWGGRRSSCSQFSGLK